MSHIMKGVGLAHTLAESFDNSEANFGSDRHWTDEYINRLTTKDGKSSVLGPMLDVLRGDAEIMPKKRVIDVDSVKSGDKDEDGGENSIVVFNRPLFKNTKVKQHLILGEFAIGVASLSLTSFYERNQDRIERGDLKRKETHIDVPDDPNLLELDRELLLPKYLLDQRLPGIALRNFYMENPHHIPECFSGIVLFWGTICKNEWCYYVPGIYRDGSKYERRICTYKVVDGKDILGSFESIDNNAAVFI